MTQPDWYRPFLAGLRDFVRSLPEQAPVDFDDRDEEFVSLRIDPPTPGHRILTIDVQPAEIGYDFGTLWTEFRRPTAKTARYLLAYCDAIRDGRVREVRDRTTGRTYHVYQLKTQGLNEFSRDSEYSFWPSVGRIRDAAITTIPPLSRIEAAA